MSFLSKSEPRFPRAAVRYGLAISSAVLAALITDRVPALHGIPFCLNFVAVALTAFLTGSKEGVVCTATSLSMIVPMVLVQNAEQKAGLAIFQSIMLCTAALVMCGIARQRELSDVRKSESERTERDLLDGIAEGFASFDEKWRSTYINVQGAEMTGHKPEQLIGKSQWEVFPSTVGTELEKTLRAARTEQRVARTTYYYTPLEKWFRSTAYPSAKGVSVLFQDVTDEVEMQDRLRMADRLSTAGRMAAAISHEINNPLEALANLLYLARTIRDWDQHDRLIQEAERQLDRAAQTAKQVLTFHRLPTERTLVDLSRVVQDAAELINTRLRDADVQLKVRASGQTQVVASPGELVQVVANLLSNAIDVSPRGGSIWVDVHHDHANLVLEVRDSGSGVPPQLITKIFQPFFTTKKGTGTGLGLWVSKNIVEKHGGTLSVSNSRAGGAVFKVELPATSVPTASEEAGAVQSA